MRVLHCPDPVESVTSGQRLFLAGPSPRNSTASWRDEACAHLRRVQFTGVVLHPQSRPGEPAVPVEVQLRWDWLAGAHADAIVFWIPRVMPELPGLTSNFEFGLWARSGKAVLGAPPEAAEMAYLRGTAELFGVPQADTLPDALDQALLVLAA
ncbi:nucleoside 2-deoxyribosyltransferase domain-containing protein [Crossiella sp. NPDC003009]